MNIQEIDYEPISNSKAGLYCYLFGVLLASVFLFVKPYKNNPFVRFHCFQSIILFTTIVLFRLFVISRLGIIGGWIDLAFLVTWIVLMVTAYKEKTLKVPVIGWVAKYFADRDSLAAPSH